MKRFRFVLLILILSSVMLCESCININPSPVQAPTPTSTQEVPLPPIEAFVADPSINPGGQQLAGLSDVKVAVDNVCQLRFGQTFSYYQTSSALSDQYKPWGISQLQKVLDGFNKTPWVSLYSDSFCCRHMSALLQRELTIRGFESWIVIGKDPKVPTGHAWVVVFLRSPNVQLVPVEATRLEIPQPGKVYQFTSGVVQTYDDYTHQGWVLQDIYQAQAWANLMSWGLTNNFDWWNKTDILQKLGLPTPITTPPTRYILSTSVNPLGGGTVSPSSGTYDSGTTVTLTATPSPGYQFASWSGNVYGTSLTITITIDTNKNATANFTLIPPPTPTFTINASVSGGNGTVSPTTQTVNSGGSASISINPNSGYSIASITDNGASVSIANPYVISNVTTSHNVVVAFSANSTPTPPAPVPTISPSTLPSGQVGVSYSTTLTAAPITGFASWVVTSGSLPPGLTLAPVIWFNQQAVPTTVTISGTPTAAGTYAFSVQVTDTTGTSAPQGFSITITPTPITQRIEYTMPAGSVSGSYVSYSKALSAGDTVSGFVELTGTYYSVDWSYEWTFQVLGPGGESLQVWKGHWVNNIHHDFSFIASYAGTYKIRVSHASSYPKNLVIEIRPPGWGYSGP